MLVAALPRASFRTTCWPKFENGWGAVASSTECQCGTLHHKQCADASYFCRVWRVRTRRRTV